jgi:predicted permease
MLIYRWIPGALQSLFRKKSLDRDLDDELRSVLAMLIDEKIRSGMAPADAVRQAKLELGGVEQVKEKVREERAGAGLDSLGQDLRFALRALRRNAGLTVAAVLILALGIGVNTALFGTVHTVLLRSLPYPDPGQLVVGQKTLYGELSGSVSRLDYFDFRERSRSFEGLAALADFTVQHTVTGGDDPELVQASYVTWNLFSTLGVAPVAGRPFLEMEESQGGTSSVLISHGYAQRRFGTAETAVGSTLILNGSPYSIVGVMPSGFRFLYDAEVWRLVDRDGPFDTVRDSHSHFVVGRLNSDVTVEQAQADVTAIAMGLEAEYPDSNTAKGLVLGDLHGYMVRNVRTSLLLLLSTTVLVLLIACGNVAGLLLARGERRQSEIAMRTALGASRSRLLRQLVSESLILTLVAGALGIGVAFLLQDLLQQLVPSAELGSLPAGVNLTAVGFTLFVSMATGLIVGVVPALRSSSLEPARQLRSESRASAGVQSTRLRSGLVVLQVALSIVLLVGSGLLIRSLSRLAAVDLGFESENLLTGQIQIQAPDYPTDRERNLFFTSALEEVEALSGVERAAIINKLPIVSLWQDWSVWPVGEIPGSPAEALSAMARWVSPGYFETMGIPILSGRDIDPRDEPGNPFVVLVSRKVAERLFPGMDPIGHVVTIGDWRDCEIVGVVEDARVNTLRGEPDAAMYMSAGQMASTSMQIAIRTAGEPEVLVRPVQELLKEKDPNVLFAWPRAMTDVVDRNLVGFRTIMNALTLFSLVAVFLAAIGIYGVLSYQVAQRKPELGLRMAIGASQRDLVLMVLKRGMGLVLLGLAIGLAVAYPGTVAMGQLLYEVGRLDLPSYAGAVLTLGLVAVVASFLPARRASKADVVEVLRAE